MREIVFYYFNICHFWNAPETFSKYFQNVSVSKPTETTPWNEILILDWRLGIQKQVLSFYLTSSKHQSHSWLYWLFQDDSNWYVSPSMHMNEWELGIQ